jgi:hypothetical protein
LHVARALTLRSRAAVLCAALDGMALPPLHAGAPAHVLSVRYATEHRAGAVLRGPGLCDRVSGTGATRRRDCVRAPPARR